MPGARVGLFGGTFDPPHVAHLAVAEAALEQGGLDQILWMPAAESPFKQGQHTTPASHRLEMVRRAVTHHPHFAVSELEVARGGTSYTVDTLRALNREDPERELFLIMGGDSLASFPRWREPEEIVRLARLVVYRRPDDGAEKVLHLAWLSERIDFIEAPPVSLSATAIRKYLTAGRSGRYLVPDEVRTYIVEEGLYAPIRTTDPPDLLRA